MLNMKHPICLKNKGLKKITLGKQQKSYFSSEELSTYKQRNKKHPSSESAVKLSAVMSKCTRPARTDKKAQCIF